MYLYCCSFLGLEILYTEAKFKNLFWILMTQVTSFSWTITYLYSVETDPINEVFKQEICEMSLLYACLIHLLLSLSQRQSFWSKIANK